jgi:hypothetical protein
MYRLQGVLRSLALLLAPCQLQMCVCPAWGSLIQVISGTCPGVLGDFERALGRS